MFHGKVASPAHAIKAGHRDLERERCHSKSRGSPRRSSARVSLPPPRGNTMANASQGLSGRRRCGKCANCAHAGPHREGCIERRAHEALPLAERVLSEAALVAQLESCIAPAVDGQQRQLFLLRAMLVLSSLTLKLVDADALINTYLQDVPDHARLCTRVVASSRHRGSFMAAPRNDALILWRAIRDRSLAASAAVDVDEAIEADLGGPTNLTALRALATLLQRPPNAPYVERGKICLMDMCKFLGFEYHEFYRVASLMPQAEIEVVRHGKSKARLAAGDVALPFVFAMLYRAPQERKLQVVALMLHFMRAHRSLLESFLTGEPLRPITPEGSVALPQSDHTTESLALGPPQKEELEEPNQRHALLSAELSKILKREIIYCPCLTPAREVSLDDVAAAVLCLDTADWATRKTRETLAANPSLAHDTYTFPGRGHRPTPTGKPQVVADFVALLKCRTVPASVLLEASASIRRVYALPSPPAGRSFAEVTPPPPAPEVAAEEPAEAALDPLTDESTAPPAGSGFTEAAALGAVFRSRRAASPRPSRGVHLSESLALPEEPPQPQMAEPPVDLLSAQLSAIFHRETIYAPRMTPEGEASLDDVAAALLCSSSEEEAARKARQVLPDNPALASNTYKFPGRGKGPIPTGNPQVVAEFVALLKSRAIPASVLLEASECIRRFHGGNGAPAAPGVAAKEPANEPADVAQGPPLAGCSFAEVAPPPPAAPGVAVETRPTEAALGAAPESNEQKALVTRRFRSGTIDVVVQRRRSDGFLNATDMCEAFGKLFHNYVKSAGTREFLDALAVDLCNSSFPEGMCLHGSRSDGSNNAPFGALDYNAVRTSLVQSQCGRGPSRGTWIHELVSVNLGQWLSPEFAVWVCRWVLSMQAPGAPAISKVAALAAQPEIVLETHPLPLTLPHCPSGCLDGKWPHFYLLYIPATNAEGACVDMLRGGRTDNMARRLGEHRREYGEGAYVVLYAPNYGHVEKLWHRKVRPHAVVCGDSQREERILAAKIPMAEVPRFIMDLHRACLAEREISGASAATCVAISPAAKRTRQDAEEELAIAEIDAKRQRLTLILQLAREGNADAIRAVLQAL